MCNNLQIQLPTDAILNVPFLIYGRDFTFVVNDEEFQTSKILSDILSPKICQMHKNDPTLNTFTINTVHRGHFSHIVDLLNFTKISIPENEISFISEVLHILGNTSINSSNINFPTITEENVIMLLNQHEQLNSILYSQQIEKEIDFISEHFYALCETQKEQIMKLHPNLIEKVISNSKLHLKDEDQLLTFINGLYQKSIELYSSFYGYVIFSNVERSSICDFIDIYDINSIDAETWRAISERLKLESNKIKASSRYEKKKSQIFNPNGNDDYCGIINYLKKQSNGDISQKVEITASSVSNPDRSPYNVTLFDDFEKDFCSENRKNGWICFDFKNNRICPTHYQIRSFKFGPNSCHPRNWVIEGSNDQKEWTILDSQNDCEILNGKNISHLFAVENKNSDEFRYIKMRVTGQTWHPNDFFIIGSFEIYGTLI